MKGSSATSARATGPLPPAGPSSARRPSPTAEFALTGPSDLPDPATHAYRKDLADVALAGRVIASHYAEPLPMSVASATVLRREPGNDSETLCELAPGDPFDMLENSQGWAWGYGGTERLVGYVRSEDLARRD